MRGTRLVIASQSENHGPLSDFLEATEEAIKQSNQNLPRSRLITVLRSQS
jgi:hypothetical protein